MSRDLAFLAVITGLALMAGAVLDDAPTAFAAGLALVVFGGRRIFAKA